MRAASDGLRRPDTTQPGGQVLALDELHDQERLAVVGAGLEAGDDVRVAQDGLRERLAPEAHRDVGVGDHLATQQLDRHGTVESWCRSRDGPWPCHRPR